MSDNLKPCPFCGSNQVVINAAKEDCDGGVDKFIDIDCVECPAAMRVYYFDAATIVEITEDEARGNAIKDWNRRAG